MVGSPVRIDTTILGSPDTLALYTLNGIARSLAPTERLEMQTFVLRCEENSGGGATVKIVSTQGAITIVHASIKLAPLEKRTFVFRLDGQAGIKGLLPSVIADDGGFELTFVDVTGIGCITRG